jgi:hypothetical protein
VPGDWLSPFGRWSEPVVLTRETEFSGTCACGRACRYRPLPGGYVPRQPVMNVTCSRCGAAVTLAAEPCGHRRGAIDWDTGAWHCYACGADVHDDDLAEAVADELRGLESVGATDPQAVPHGSATRSRGLTVAYRDGGAAGARWARRGR